MGAPKPRSPPRLGVSQPTISRVLSESPEQGELAALPFGAKNSAPAQDSAPGSPREIARIEAGAVPSRYAGAMLLHHFVSDIGAENVLSSPPRAVARLYDALVVMLSAAFGFALGASSAEGIKHLARTDAAALLGLASFPELRTRRPRLAAIAEQSDPLAVQRAFAKAMLDTDEHSPRLQLGYLRRVQVVRLD